MNEKHKLSIIMRVTGIITAPYSDEKKIDLTVALIEYILKNESE
jgi:hypothetical protein